MGTNSSGNSLTLIMRRHTSLLWFLLCLLFVDAGANPSRQVHDLAVLVDPSGSETIESVSDPARTHEFVALSRSFSVGYTRDVHWLRFTLYPPPLNDQGLRESLLLIYPPFLDDIRLFLPRSVASGAGGSAAPAVVDAPAFEAVVPNADGTSAGAVSAGVWSAQAQQNTLAQSNGSATSGFEERRSGDLLPFANREYPYRSHVHTVLFPSAEPITAYLRIQTTSSSWAVMYVWPPEKFVALVAIESLVLGVFFGLLLAGILANLWYGLWRKQQLYLSFLVYLVTAFFTFLSINGLVPPIVFADNPEWSHHFTSVTFLLLVAAMTWFYIHALAVRKAPVLVRAVYYGTIAISLLALPSPFLDVYLESMQVLIVAALLMVVLGAARSLQLWWHQEKPGSLLFIAHTFTLLGSIPSALLVVGWLPGDLLTHYGFQIGIIGSLLALQIMLILRFRSAQQARINLRWRIKKMESRVRKERQHIEQQRRFMSMLTHELKTPLSVIRLYLQAAEPSARMQRLASDAINDMNAIIDRCALSARVEEKALGVAFEVVDLCQLATEVHAAWPGAERLQLAIPNESCSLQTDPRLVQVVLCNLVDNSLKYSLPGTPVSLALAAQDLKGVPGWMVTLSNRVQAESQIELDQFFEKYYRGKTSRRVSGSGLGLYVVKGIVASLQGSVRFDRDADILRCTLWLPKQMT